MKRIVIPIVLFLLVMLPEKTVWAVEPDLNAVDKALQDTTKNNEFSISRFVEDASKGEDVLEPDNLLSHIKNTFFVQWKEQRGQLISLILLGMLAGIFFHFSQTLGKKELGDMGFYIMYLLMFGISTASFFQAFAVAKEALTGLLDFMQVMVPAFALSLATITGSSTSGAFYQLNLMGMTAVDAILINLVLPGTQMYYLLNTANYFMKEAKFSKLAELLYSFLRWTIKTTFGVIIGLQVVQMLLYPVIDQVKRNAVWKTASSLPGMGGLFGTVTETILGTGMVIKSALGIGGLIGICLICLLPILKLVMFILIYKLSSALLQPVSDHRLVTSLEIVAKSGKMLLLVVASSSLLFLLSLAIVLQATNHLS